MINTDMRLYDYYLIGAEDAYGQAQVPAEDAIPAGQIKMTINITSQSIQDNINYADSQYVGLTHFPIDDTYVIQYENKRLKVLYVNPKGRMKQVFLKVL